MITIQSDGATYVRIDGHAGYAPVGSDIVCAAVSVLYETLKELLKGQAEVTERDGYSRLKARHWQIRPWKEEYLEYFITGIEGIASAYPQHVRLEIRRD